MSSNIPSALSADGAAHHSGANGARGTESPTAADPASALSPLAGLETATRAWQRAQALWKEREALWLRLQERGLREPGRWLGYASAHVGGGSLAALCGIADHWPLDTEHVMFAYTQGLFPLYHGGKLRWHCPPERFVQFLDEVRISGNMRRELKQCQFDYSFDRAPEAVLHACADRPEGTWLTPRLQQIFMDLVELGTMHSVEAWRAGELVGGSFGMSIGRVWTSESMFHRADHAGKGQRMHLFKHLQDQGYVCVDSQTYSPHVARFGAREIPRAEYRNILARGLASPARFYPGR